MNPRKIAAPFLAVLLCSTGPQLAHAQFTTDPSTPLAIAAGPQNERGLQIRKLDDGGFYAAWLEDGPSPGVRLQRFDAGGHAMWAAGGVHVSDSGGHGNSIGMDLDSNEHVVLGFEANHSGTNKATLTKLDGTGAPLWVPGGVQLPFVGSGVQHRVVVGNDDSVMYSFGGGAFVYAARFDANGTALWAQPQETFFVKGNASLGQVFPGKNGAIFRMLHFTEFSTSGGFESSVHVERLDANGGVTTFGFGHPSGNWNATGVSDGKGGVFFVSIPKATPPPPFNPYTWELFVQHVDELGVPQFPPPGVPVTTRAGSKTTPSLAFDEAEGELFVSWTHDDFDGFPFNVGVQKLGVDGRYLWSREGVLLEPHDVQFKPRSQVVSMGLAGHEGVAVLYDTSPSRLIARRLGDDAQPYGPPMPNANASLVVHGFSVSVDWFVRPSPALGSYLVAWTDSGTGTDLYAQNLLADGSLGGAATIATLNGSGANPLALSAGDAPHVGQVWSVVVDKATAPSTLVTRVQVQAGALAAPQSLPTGELLLDLTTATLATSLQVSAAPSDAHAFPIPAVISAIGQTVYAQALLGGPSGAQLTNALAATVGL